MIVYVLLAIVFIGFSITVAFFLSRRLSPIPFFPTNNSDLPMIIKSLLDDRYQVSSIQYSVSKKGKNSKILNTKYSILNTVIDLGAGTGTVIFEAATTAFKKKLDTQFIAVEINPVLTLIMRLRRMTHPNRKNLHILRADLFNLDLKKILVPPHTKYPLRRIEASSILHTVYLYVGPFVMERLKPVLEKFPKNSRILSYMYAIPGWEKRLIATKKGKNTLYIYQPQ